MSRHLPAFVILALALAACGDVKDTLGLKREAPDEFRVVSRPPLSIPPEFTLRPPSASATGPAAEPASRAAKSLVLGEDAANADMTLEEKQAETSGVDTAVTPVTAGDVRSPAESRFLENAGADIANGNIRETLYEEALPPAQEDAGMFDGWWPGSKKKSDPTVDAEGEKERLEKNQAEGKPATSGETPTVESKHEGGLMGLFK